MQLKRGQIVEVTFLDHVQGGGKPLEFVVYGRLLRIGKVSLTIASWTYSDPRHRQDPHDRNIVSFVILRSTIKTLHPLGK